MGKKTIVVSAVNLVEGGTLTILKNCLSYLDSSPKMHEKYDIIALVHKKEMFQYKHITLLEFPKVKSSWLLRIYHEYWKFYKLSLSLNPFLWLSLHDISPNIKATHKAVYCHNPTPFYHSTLTDLIHNSTLFLFSYFYKYLYQINISTNDYVIVQQQWLRDAFRKMYSLSAQKVIVAYPNENLHMDRIQYKKTEKTVLDSIKIFFFPSLSRPFKNFEIICRASELLMKNGCINFKVVLTINGQENIYAKKIVDKYCNIPMIDFCGRLTYEEVCKMYELASCLIFPSKLETWGLPISEFMHYEKPMIIANLPYAHETASGAKQVAFFDPNNAKQLADLMQKIINSDVTGFKPVYRPQIDEPYTCSWEELFNKLL